MLLEQPSIGPRANRQKKAERDKQEKQRAQQRLIEQQLNEQRKRQQKILEKAFEKEEAVGIGIEEEQKRRNQFLQNIQAPKSEKKKKFKKSKQKSEYDKVTIQKILLLLVHLLKKFSALNSSTMSTYTNIFSTLTKEILEIGFSGKYLMKLLSDDLDFKSTFKSVFSSFMTKADAKDPIVNEFWCQKYELSKNVNVHQQSDQQSLLISAVSNNPASVKLNILVTLVKISNFCCDNDSVTRRITRNWRYWGVVGLAM